MSNDSQYREAQTYAGRREADYYPPHYAPIQPSPKVYPPAPQRYQPAPRPGNRTAAATRGFAQLFGLDIRAAALVFIIDLIVFTGDALSFGVLLPLGVVVASVLGFIVYKIQSKWYGDDHDSALIKALIVFLLTAIPLPISSIIAVPGGILGLVNMMRRK